MAIDRLQAKLQNQNLDPNGRARIENRLAFEQRGGNGMQASQRRTAPPPMQPQQPQPMQRPQPQQMPQQQNPWMQQGQGAMQGFNAALGSPNAQMGQMANRFANNYGNLNGQNPSFKMPPPPAGGYNDMMMRYSPEESIAMRQRMEAQMQSRQSQMQPYGQGQQQMPQNQYQMMPYNFKGNGNGLL